MSFEPLLKSLKTRFDKFPHRHAKITWQEVEEKLSKHPEKLQVLQAMEDSGGEPDLIGKVPNSGELIFCDCSAETPSGRRSLCFDEKALNEREENRPISSVEAIAAQIGITLLNEQEYRALQELGPFDQKTSSWIATPDSIRKLGGALFGDYRYGTTFIYHNGAQSYYANRAFRGMVKV
ncbi:MAG: DUF4256 domain-containing protein [Flavobacteriales bacterium]